MELKRVDGTYIISQEEKNNIDKMVELAMKMRNKYFSFGSDLAQFVKLCDLMQKSNNKKEQ